MHVFIDTTDILKLEEAKNNIRCQKIMFASASHEFRTPLNAIVNSLSFIGDYDQAIKRELGAYAMFTSEKAESSVMEKFTKLEKFIKMGSNSSILLLSLIEDILSMAKFESGNFKVNKTVFSLDSLISEIDDIFSCQWEMKHIKFMIEAEEKIRVMDVYSDRNRIKQVLLNILSNAWKFTFKGEITLKIRLGRDFNIRHKSLE